MKWSDLTQYQKIITVLTLLTALIHLGSSFLWFGYMVLGIDLGVLFIINGIGYIALLAGLYFVPQLADKRDLMRFGLGLWTFGTIIMWILFHPGGTLLDSSIVNKLIEAAILIFLYLDYTKIPPAKEQN